MSRHFERINDHLLVEGIAFVEDVYSLNEIAALNHAVNPVFSSMASLPRAYVKPDKMLELGIFRAVLSPRMRKLIFAIMPDPVLHHLHLYEIAANETEPHIFSEAVSGWHRDPDAEYVAMDATHISIFVYLSNVNAEDGPFEFALHKPIAPLKSNSHVVSITGPAGTSFVWHRRFFHRAAPNRGPHRRRVLKVSVQRNSFESPRLKKPEFQNALKGTPPGEKWMDLLLGRYQGGSAPKIQLPSSPVWEPIARAMPIDLPDDDLQRAYDEENAKEAATRSHD